MSMTQGRGLSDSRHIEPFGMRIAELSKRLCCSTSTIHRLLASGALVAVKRGTSTLITLPSIRAYEASLPRATFGGEPPSAA
jgi:excisionase family DNA binding protein